MTPEIIARVDAWLAARKEWVSASRDRQMLAVEWRVRSLSWPRFAAGSRAGVEASMAGVLLELVRKAWGEPDAHAVMHRHPKAGGPWWSISSFRRSPIAPHLVALAKTEAEALVAALEAAPC